MSALYVRQTVREWLARPELTVPFYDTVNVEQNPSDEVWSTASFDASFRERLTFCEDSWIEEGDINVVYPSAGSWDAVVRPLKPTVTLMSIRDQMTKYA